MDRPGVEDSSQKVDTATMDVAQIGELRAWATRLEERAESDELRAAAKAILMLTEEVEKLQARLAVGAAVTTLPSTAEDDAAEPEATRSPERGGLTARLKRTFGVE